jgi:hypothetical protein
MDSNARVEDDQASLQDDIGEVSEQTTKELTPPTSGSNVEIANPATNAFQCPRCRSSNTVIETTRPWQDGLRVRYHRCRGCRMPFKSVEEQKEALDVQHQREST